MKKKTQLSTSTVLPLEILQKFEKDKNNMDKTSHPE
jgi:hypothetical protein